MVSSLGKAVVKSLHGVQAEVVTVANVRNQYKDEASLRAESSIQGIKEAAEKNRKHNRYRETHTQLSNLDTFMESTSHS